MKYLTPAEIDKKNTKIAKKAEEYRNNGYTLDQVATIIWNKYGNTSEVKNGKLALYTRYGFGEKFFIFAEIS